MTAIRFDRSEPDAGNGFQAASAHLIVASHARLLRRDLLPDGEPTDLAQRLYRAPFIVLAHDAAPDPVFFYANLAAQELFAMPWREIVRLPSRLSAEPLARKERQRLLDRVARDGFIDDYGGVRISARGERFRICGATVWNLVSDQGTVVGQAATFATWLPLR
ncbi:MEKHLA domain-containing protein [Accumulibacter sp.]|uniref:MEKHLA domain-containing protein n=1 Tax=Accumulibacter sp. TaxID=2053492 RepID=UPI0035B0AF98